MTAVDHYRWVQAILFQFFAHALNTDCIKIRAFFGTPKNQVAAIIPLGLNDRCDPLLGY